jgi:hypothetical protein
MRAESLIPFRSSSRVFRESSEALHEHKRKNYDRPIGYNYKYELFSRGHGPSKLRSMLLVVVICNLV